MPDGSNCADASAGKSNLTVAPDQRTEHKLTAEEVEQDCPVVLQDLAKRITAHLDKARNYQGKAEQHCTAVAQYLAKAKEACDDGGFNAFREKFFPELGKTRIYQLLAIATDRKSVAETKAGTRARVAKHRAKKAAASVTVTDKLVPEAGTASFYTRSRRPMLTASCQSKQRNCKRRLQMPRHLRREGHRVGGVHRPCLPAFAD